MGTSEPPEHWAPPDSLDPTPVWKQYALALVLALAFAAAVGAYAYAAVLPDVVAPPAALPGGRVVLAGSQFPPGTTKVVGVGGWERSFYLTNLGRDYAAVRKWWSAEVGGNELCGVDLVESDPSGRFRDACTGSTFDVQGRVVSGSAPRGLDRYLVSRKGDRLIVNTDHLIQGKP